MKQQFLNACAVDPLGYFWDNGVDNKHDLMKQQFLQANCPEVRFYADEPGSNAGKGRNLRRAFEEADGSDLTRQQYL